MKTNLLNICLSVPSRRLWVLLLSLAFALTDAAAQGEVRLPLRVPLELLRAPLTEIYADLGDAPRELFRDGTCRYFSAGRPLLEQRADGLHLLVRVAGRLAVELGGKCLGLPEWSGSTDLELIPYVGPDWQVRMRIGRNLLRDETGHEAPLLGFISELSMRYVNSRIEAFAFDLAPPRDEALALLRASAPAVLSADLEQALQSLRPGEAQLLPEALVVPLLMAVSAVWRQPAAPPVASAAPLDKAALGAAGEAFEPLDAFVVFVIKQAGLDLADADLRERLFDLLLESRYRLVEILSEDDPVQTGDPLRELFIEDWEELRAILADAEQRGQIRGRLLQYVQFLNAGDVLLAIDSAAPGLGLQLTADGLRRLARSLQPGIEEDPLHYDWEVDPELRRLFDLGPEPMLPPLEEPDPGDWILNRLLTPAFAAEAEADPRTALGKRLDRWVPGTDELPDYQRVVDGLLRLGIELELADAGLAPAHTEIFRHLVPATALLESCWRQFIREGGEVSFLRSPAGSVGMMQVNQYVWRGFYQLERLKWDMPYNVQAGIQILLRYLRAHGIPAGEQNGDPEHIPRVTYAVYNAGPKAAKRLLKRKTVPPPKGITARFLRFYHDLVAGGSVDLEQCGVGPAVPPPAVPPPAAG